VGSPLISTGQLRARYEAADVPTDGSQEVAVHPGSWSGWTTDPERPVGPA